jgi:hypothetical protein
MICRSDGMPIGGSTVEGGECPTSSVGFLAASVQRLSVTQGTNSYKDVFMASYTTAGVHVER